MSGAIIGRRSPRVIRSRYRLSKDGVLRRDGWDWFFVPEDQRDGAEPKREEGPGDDPRLPLDAAE